SRFVTREPHSPTGLGLMFPPLLRSPFLSLSPRGRELGRGGYAIREIFDLTLPQPSWRAQRDAWLDGVGANTPAPLALSHKGRGCLKTLSKSRGSAVWRLDQTLEI